jgi:hypothetical protein
VAAAFAAAVLVLVAAPRGAAPADWLQWGGPGRNFMPDAAGLASSWPPGGPKRLWSRPLGEGHSAILAEAGRIYTMYRPLQRSGERRGQERGQEEVVIALDAASGKTAWEFTYPSPTSGLDFSQGAGPHATPLISGNRIYATSTRKELFALDKATGKTVWSHDFMKEYGAPPPGRGYACSPTLHNGTIIVTVGGRGQAVAAFNSRAGPSSGRRATSMSRRRRRCSSTSMGSCSWCSLAATRSPASIRRTAACSGVTRTRPTGG